MSTASFIPFVYDVPFTNLEPPKAKAAYRASVTAVAKETNLS
jgi:hypothetical protein